LSSEGQADAAYPRDINGLWRENRFVIHQDTDIFSYDEQSGTITKKDGEQDISPNAR
jgi:hypothetical protein